MIGEFMNNVFNDLASDLVDAIDAALRTGAADSLDSIEVSSVLDIGHEFDLKLTLRAEPIAKD